MCCSPNSVCCYRKTDLMQQSLHRYRSKPAIPTVCEEMHYIYNLSVYPHALTHLLKSTLTSATSARDVKKHLSGWRLPRGAMRTKEVLFMHAREREGGERRWFPGRGMASLNGCFQTGRGRLKLEKQKERMMCRGVLSNTESPLRD